MKFVKSVHAVATVGGIVAPKALDTSSPYSIRNAAASIAYDTMSYYNGNKSATDTIQTGDVQDPYYWWVAGGLWGAMLDYYHYTGDPSYNDVVIQALLAPTNLGPNHAYVPPEHAFEEGNDDLSFWGGAVISAAERNFPQPDKSLPSWLEIGANVFNSLMSRWDTKNCGGGLLWQIYASNPNGLTYKNSVSNGGFFQIAARMARATGNDTYLEWAEKIWDWTYDVGFIDHRNYHVYDGGDIKDNCKINAMAFTYTTGIYMYGAAVLAEYTGKKEWADRAEKILDGASWFFNDDVKPPIMYEAACETVDRCNSDMTTFKGFMSRYMWQTSVLLPDLKKKVQSYLVPSAAAAAATCTGGKNGRQCGQKWYTGKFDGKTGLGEQMCALETIQGLLIYDAPPPLAAKDIKVVRDTNWKPLNTYKTDPPKDNSNAAETRTNRRGESAGPRKTTDGSPASSDGSSDDETKNSNAGRLNSGSLSWIAVGLGSVIAAWGLA